MPKPAFPRSSLALALAAMSLPAIAEDAVQTLPQIKVQATAEAAATEGYQGFTSRASTKTDTPLLDTPQSVSVVTQQQIKDQAVQSMADAMRYSPGVGSAQGEGNRDAVIIRGSTSTGDFYLDGVRDDVQYYRDLYNIDRVEVLKGANGLAFGRGGAGGVVNRVSKAADGERVREFSTALGIENSRRASLDVGQELSEHIAGRINLVTEKSDLFRDGSELKRNGISPSLGFKLGSDTRLSLDSEYFNDLRVADRGIPSRNGKPVNVAPDTFFGNAEQSPTEITVRSVGANLEHRFNSQLRINNRIRYADYDKYYQNVFASGAVNAAGVFNVQAYRDDTQRQNLFNQTDLVMNLTTGPIRHTLVAGVEAGRQDSESLRLDGRFASGCATAAKTTTASLSNPKATAQAFDCLSRQSETQADVLSFYVQDQVQLSAQWQAVIGLRRDQFDTDFENILVPVNTGKQKDREWAPRAALIFKPIESATAYASYSKTFQPRAGDQLASFDALTRALDPEQFINTELGLKWDVRPELSLSAAAYRLERHNIAVVDPTDTNKRVIIDGQRVQGVELGATGKLTSSWSLISGYTYADSEITKNQLNTDGSINIAAGNATAQTPEHSFSLWNRYDFSPQYGAAIGVISRSDMYAQDNNAVKLPGYARVDAALFFKPVDTLDLQMNIENLGDREYVVNAHNSNNITPGSPLSVRLSANWRF